MAAKTLYTSIGRLEQRRDADGACPVIHLGGKEYMMDIQEIAVWTSIAWHIVRREEIGRLYGRLCQGIDLGTNRTWSECVDRLLTRGLLVSGTGETEYDALYDMLSALYIIPATGTLWLKAFALLKLTLLGRVSFAAARQLFRRDDRTTGEEHIMHLAGQALLSTAEIIKCMEKGVSNLTDNESIMNAVYDDRSTTSDNLPFTAKTFPGAQNVTLNVANLYLRKQIVFERV